jgi:hypothetical protein
MVDMLELDDMLVDISVVALVVHNDTVSVVENVVVHNVVHIFEIVYIDDQHDFLLYVRYYNFFGNLICGGYRHDCNQSDTKKNYANMDYSNMVNTSRYKDNSNHKYNMENSSSSYIQIQKTNYYNKDIDKYYNYCNNNFDNCCYRCNRMLNHQ